MRSYLHVILPLALLAITGCRDKIKEPGQNRPDEDFPPAMVQFSPYAHNPVFEGTNTGSWDDKIRERGYILFENGLYKMWYTGYNPDISDHMYLGYATSPDGIKWERQSKQPILPESWIEDMQVFPYEGTYYMVAEGVGDIAHLLTSPDGISWKDHGDLTILKVNGEPIDKGPYGTPTVWVENGNKYLFYERNDLGIWLATSKDFKTWTNVQDEPVLNMGPTAYDNEAVAANQIVKYKGKYYMFYIATANPDWKKPGVNAIWTSNVAMSTDLINWTKYPDNPIVEGDHSSPILIFDGKKYTLYTMHDKVWRYNAIK
ncbi:hypothetical protein K8352_12925 [Flavobacteriaceae bacterium F89]|uniref:Glycosylase n=1 Tax=Cerina litoralis TaxID=2874477 RepID=A0AAE3JTN0_9FLAO|nr:hypothetical protein [Cerina litoralis]MCG2461657.1 hypothetical protein [Cerina litoralis]